MQISRTLLATALSALALFGCDDDDNTQAAGGAGGAGGTGGAIADVGVGGGGGSAEIGLVSSSLARDLDPEVADGDLQILVNGEIEASLALLNVLPAEGNLFFSPISIHQAMAMAWAGAGVGSTTESEIADALNFGMDQAAFHPAYNRLDLELASREDVELPEDATGDAPTLRMANSLWGRVDVTFVDAFLDTLAVNYGAGLRVLDFAGDPDGSRETINTWVEDKTEDRIQDLLPPGSITSDTALVLTNAIYFLGSWTHPFLEQRTADAPFTLLDGAEIQVPTMRLATSEGFYHHIGDDYRAIRLPYVGDELSMTVIVPPAGGFEAFQAGLTVEGLVAMVDGMGYGHVNVQLPKFTIDGETISLKTALTALGMEAPFSMGADFSGIRASGGLVISDVLHQAFIAVDEKGTEAAAATAIVFEDSSAPMDPVDLFIDGPFLVLIRDDITGAVLFLGRVVDPR